MHRRKISIEEIHEALKKGDTIEDYPDDTPFPSRLISAIVHSRPIHVVAADNPETGETIIISVYEPNVIKWDSYYKTRRKS